ncbi:MAG TPA: 2-C-methyl-D-erythritol 4-phosphate cytidylyltransferase [Ktedonobacterales bacterium]|nr:2-C-methyl-D-erythritol 4-phosphate cytidylyltransferase [Ktedonobacterales bacterium]
MTSYSHAVPTAGAVAALLVATAPDATPQSEDLLWRTVAGRALITWPLQALSRCNEVVGCSILATRAHATEGREALFSVPWSGGPSVSASFRDERTWLGILENGRTHTEWLVVVDANLPLVTPDAIRAGLLAAEKTGVAIASEPVKETLKRVEGDIVVETLPRDALRRLITPLVLRRDAVAAILGAYDDARHDPNDLASLLALAGVPITVFDAGYPAVRVNSEDDLAIVETLLLQRLSEAHPS